MLNQTQVTNLVVVEFIRLVKFVYSIIKKHITFPNKTCKYVFCSNPSQLQKIKFELDYKNTLSPWHSEQS